MHLSLRSMETAARALFSSPVPFTRVCSDAVPAAAVIQVLYTLSAFFFFFAVCPRGLLAAAYFWFLCCSAKGQQKIEKNEPEK